MRVISTYHITGVIGVPAMQPVLCY